MNFKELVASREIQNKEDIDKLIADNRDNPIIVEITKGYKIVPLVSEILRFRVDYLNGCHTN